MNRAIALATLLSIIPLANLSPAIAQAPPAAGSPVPSPLPSGASPPPSPSPTPVPTATPKPDIEHEGPRDKQQRIDIFQDRRLIYDFNKGTGVYTLRQGPDTIYDVDFVELMQDPSLERFWLGERNKDWALWLPQAGVALPAGVALFMQNFLIKDLSDASTKTVGSQPGPLAFFANPSKSAGDNISDPRTFALSLLGVAIAVYGAYNLSLWVLEELDQYHPNRLDEQAILPRVHAFNDDLQERLGLEPSDIPSPPTPRPSDSPSPNTSPTPRGLFGQPPAPPLPIDQSNPYGGAPAAIPAPLQLQEPGVVPSALVPSPQPIPSQFLFPGRPGREPAKAKPSVKPSPVTYPGTEP